MTSLPARRGSPGFGVSSLAASLAATAGGGVMAYLAKTARASAKVVGSATVGPEPMTEGSSPGTSEMTKVTTRAGAAAAASLPPLMAERCLRTQFISVIVAPDLSSARLTCCLSAKVRPGAASASSAEAPPEIRQSTRSSAVSPPTAARMRAAAAAPAASGTGWEASMTSICLVVTPWP